MLSSGSRCRGCGREGTPPLPFTWLVGCEHIDRKQVQFYLLCPECKTTTSHANPRHVGASRNAESRQLAKSCGPLDAPPRTGEKGCITSECGQSLSTYRGIQDGLVTGDYGTLNRSPGPGIRLRDLPIPGRGAHLSSAGLCAAVPPRVAKSADTPRGAWRPQLLRERLVGFRGGPSTRPARAPHGSGVDAHPLRPHAPQQVASAASVAFQPLQPLVDSGSPHRSARGGGPFGVGR